MSSEYDDTKLNLFSQDMTHNPEDSDDGLDSSSFDQFSQDAKKFLKNNMQDITGSNNNSLCQS